MSESPSSEQSVRVWDPWVRISHWLTAVAFLGAYFITEDNLPVHVWLGYLIGALLIIRIVWGFVGTEHARFRDFLFGPGRVAAYIGAMLRGQPRRYLGHNPAGAVMILLLLLGLAGTTVTGLQVYAAEEKAGPLAGWYAGAGLVELPAARANGYEEEEEEGHEEHEGEEAEFLEEAHEFFANATMALVFLHVIGVIVSSRLHGENLARAMVTGRKRPLEDQERRA
jgi:cytochrome b